jgi:hypothetical protein
VLASTDIEGNKLYLKVRGHVRKQKKRKLFGGQNTLTDISFKVNKVTDADVSDKEQGNENEIGSDEPKEKVTRRFQEKWLSLYKWLKYDDNAMFCKVCIDGNKHNTFTTGSTNFRTSSLIPGLYE